MKNFMNTRTFTTVASLLVTGLLTGCGWNHGERFAADDEPKNIGKFAQAQAAAGAKEDATLNDVHFHGNELTSLGQGKLDLIVKGTPAGDSVKVYLNVSHDLVADRETAVTVYLKKAGVVDKNIARAEGNNTNLTTPTAYNLGGVYKADGGSYNGQAAVETSTAGAMTGPASGGGH